MTPLFASPTASTQGTETVGARRRRLLALAAIAPLGLLGCAAEAEPSPATPQNSQAEQPPSESEEPQQTQAPESDDQKDTPPGDGDSDEVPEPDEMDDERTEELGAYFSEEEACMSIGWMLEGLQTDMNEGVEEQDVLDDIYSAVEQNYVLAPTELREPLENILVLLDTEVEDLDEKAVLVAAEPVDGWLTVGFCEGEYHNQASSDEA